jgi:ABC-type transport system substrate-binding protein
LATGLLCLLLLLVSSGSPSTHRPALGSTPVGAGFSNGTTGLNLISSADVSADSLSITFHLKHAYVPFLSYWVDGWFAPLPAHHFSTMAPEAILQSLEDLSPRVTSGPFLMAESVPGDHYTLVRNPRYYRASEGLPYLDKVVFRITDPDTRFKDLQASSIDSAWFLDVGKVPEYQRLKNYMLTAASSSAVFEALWFNFHNTVLASHLEVRQAMAMAIDHQALIEVARHGFAMPLCTDHPSAMHPGYVPVAPCPELNPAAANKLLDDSGWVKGADGVRAKGGQRLEFEYSTTSNVPWRIEDEAIQNARMLKRSCSATSRRSASSSTSRTLPTPRSLALSWLEGRRPHPREPWRADLTSLSGGGPLAMTPTILSCSRATRSRPMDQTLPSTATLLWMPSTSRNW